MTHHTYKLAVPEKHALLRNPTPVNLGRHVARFALGSVSNAVLAENLQYRDFLDIVEDTAAGRAVIKSPDGGKTNYAVQPPAPRPPRRAKARSRA